MASNVICIGANVAGETSFLKEHATVQELKKEIAALKAGLQQMSDELRMSRPVQLTKNSQ